MSGAASLGARVGPDLSRAQQLQRAKAPRPLRADERGLREPRASDPGSPATCGASLEVCRNSTLWILIIGRHRFHDHALDPRVGRALFQPRGLRPGDMLPPMSRARTYSICLSLGLISSAAACSDDVAPVDSGESSTVGDGDGDSGDGDGDSGDGDGDTGDGDGDTGDGDGDDPEAWDGSYPTLDCDPLVPSYCAFPFPNNVYTVPNPDSVTGLRTEFAPIAIPESNGGGVTDVTPFNTRDGFSPGINMVTHLPGATVTGLPNPDTIDDSLLTDCPTVLLDTVTGERVPHWAELDMSTDDPDRRAFLIRPAVRLEDARRYIVAIRGVVDAQGAPLEPSEGFLALREELESTDEAINSRRALYQDIFTELEGTEVGREDLQLAWDFTTSSREDTTSFLIHMRDEALASVGPEGPAYTLTEVIPDWGPGIAYHVVGEMEVPLYLDIPGPGGVLTLGEDGLPEAEGTATYPFTVIIPSSAADEPAPLMQFGHGLFGDYTGVDVTANIVASENLVSFGMSWIGMSSEDPAELVVALGGGDLSAFRTLPDRLLQSHVNALLMMRMMTGDFKDDPAIQIDGQSPINADERYYFGGSLGGIMGSVYMSITPDVQRGGLGVPGQSFNLLLPRSVLFAPFFDVLALNYSDPLDISLFLAAAMLLWDRAEPTGFTPYLRGGELTGGFGHEVLIQAAMGDHQVTNVGTHVMARTIGAPIHEDSGEYPWGLDVISDGHEGSATIMHDFGLPAIPLENVPMELGDDPHALIWQMMGNEGVTTLSNFLRTGVVINDCDGVCDPA